MLKDVDEQVSVEISVAFINLDQLFFSFSFSFIGASPDVVDCSAEESCLDGPFEQCREGEASVSADFSEDAIAENVVECIKETQSDSVALHLTVEA